MAKRKYFAQTSTTDPKLHKSKHFEILEDAINFVEENGGGIVKNRRKDRFYEQVYPIVE